MASPINRRRVLAGMGASLAALPLAGCNINSQDPTVRRVLNGAESLTKSAQRLLLSRQSLAQEFSEADISRHFRANGPTNPDDPAYVSLAKSGFQDWRL